MPNSRRRPGVVRCSPASPATSSPCSSREIESVAEIERIARRVVLAISEPFELCSHSVDIGASIGVAISPDHGTSIEALMRAADIAMYRAKSSGGGQHCLFDAEARGRAPAEDRDRKSADRSRPARRIPARLPAADEPGHRRDCRRRGAAPLEPSARRACACPNSFIPIAERTGVIAEIGDWVIGRSRSSARQLAPRRRSTGRLSFNISPRQVERADFFIRLRQTFADAERAAVADRARVHRERGDGS